MFMQRALSAGVALLFLVLGLVSIFPDIISTARSQSTQETAIGPDARDALARIKQFAFQSRTFRSYAGRTQTGPDGPSRNDARE